MTWIDVINTSVGLMGLVLGGFAIWLSLYLYIKAKDSETATTNALTAIRAQSDALQKLTARWMDRFTRHATEPRPADEGLLQLVQVVAALPSTLLDRMHSTQNASRIASDEELLSELVDSYVCLYYYSSLSNVLAQGHLPPEENFDTSNELHTGTQAIVDRTAGDCLHMESVLNKVDETRLRGSGLGQLLNEAIHQWRPHVAFASQAYERQRTATETK
jgi:hypothetical protein